ncbi:MAG: hypothetical protein JNK76_14815, partial [Planctomycetales bacterium]|nr:hypothetical protein [Planctomycetales bacterium]
FGIIINYASYLRKKDDVALSSLTSASINEFFEVCLGGLITLPAAFIFLGASALTMGTFGLGFNALPNVFAVMPAGRFFGFVWFLMLFLAAITSSISMLQPVLAFLEEGLGLRRRGAVVLLFVVTAIGSGFTVYFSKGLTALDTFDFWVGTFLIYTLAMFQTILYGWVFGIERGEKELHHGAHLHVPRLVQYILKYVAPAYLLVIFGTFSWQSLLSHEEVKFEISEWAAHDEMAGFDSKMIPAAFKTRLEAEKLSLPTDATVTGGNAGGVWTIRDVTGKPLYIVRDTRHRETFSVAAYKVGTLEALLYNPAALWSVIFILVVTALLMAGIFIAGRRWQREGRLPIVDAPSFSVAKARP